MLHVVFSLHAKQLVEMANVHSVGWVLKDENRAIIGKLVHVTPLALTVVSLHHTT